LLWTSYVLAAASPSISYAAPRQARRMTKVPSRSLERTADTDLQSSAWAGKIPAACDVLGEIALLLAVHLTVALAIVLALRMCGVG
jgi:hypothetical protein